MRDLESDDTPRLERIKSKLKMKASKTNHGKIKHRRATEKNLFYGKDRFIRSQ